MRVRGVTARVVVVVTGLACALAACSSTVNRSTTAGASSSTVAFSSTASPLVFREVLGTIPYRSSPGPSAGVGGGSASCDSGARVTARARQTPGAHIILADRRKSSCYLLGPTLLTVTSVGSADAVANRASSNWEVSVHPRER